jgi:hypothetical protein
MPRNPKPDARLGNQAAHDAYEALKIKAPMRCAQLGISRDKVLKRFEHWADNATRTEVHVSQGIKMGESRVEATDLRIKANENLAKIMGCYKDGDEQASESQRRQGQIVINLSFLDPERAQAVLSVQSRGSEAVDSERGVQGEPGSVASRE